MWTRPWVPSPHRYARGFCYLFYVLIRLFCREIKPVCVFRPLASYRKSHALLTVQATEIIRSWHCNYLISTHLFRYSFNPSLHNRLILFQKDRGMLIICNPIVKRIIPGFPYPVKDFQIITGQKIVILDLL